MTRAYQPEIDGVRAIAVTAVVLLHGHAVPLSGGFAGVDVFFVLSGYLISAILLDELARDRFSVWRFYERRVRRIFPALFVALALTTATAWVLLDPSQLETYSKSLLAVVVFLSNFFFAAGSGYFSPALENAPLLHTWSLAVEEQFYVVFPLLLLALVRLAPRRLFFTLTVIGLVSLAASEWGARYEPDENFYFTFTRSWELVAGALAAVWRRRSGPQQSEWIAAGGLALMLGSMVLHDEATPYPSLATLVPVIGTAAVILYAGRGTWTGRLLSSRPFVAIGLISYPAYLFHQPLFAFARLTLLDPPGPVTIAILTLASYLLAWATYAWVEQPFRRSSGRLLPNARGLFVAGAIGSAAFVALAGVGVLSDGNDRIWRAAHAPLAERLDWILAAERSHGLPRDDGSCRFNTTRLDGAPRARIEQCAEEHGPAVVVLGDSHAIDLFSAMTAVSPNPFVLGVTDGGCRPGDDDPDCGYYDDLARLVADPADLVEAVVFTQAGSYLLRGARGEEGSRQLFARVALDRPLPALTVNRDRVDTLAHYLGRLARRVPVTWLASRVEPHLSRRRVLEHDCRAPIALRPGQIEIFEALDRAATLAAEREGVRYVGLARHALDPETDILTCEALYWSDGDHWSQDGERRFGERLLPHLPARLRSTSAEVSAGGAAPGAAGPRGAAARSAP